MSDLTIKEVCLEDTKCPNNYTCADCIFQRMNKKLLAEQEKVKKLVKRLVETESYIDDRYVKDRINETLEEVEGV